MNGVVSEHHAREMMVLPVIQGMPPSIARYFVVCIVYRVFSLPLYIVRNPDILRPLQSLCNYWARLPVCLTRYRFSLPLFLFISPSLPVSHSQYIYSLRSRPLVTKTPSAASLLSQWPRAYLYDAVSLITNPIVRCCHSSAFDKYPEHPATRGTPLVGKYW